MTFQIRERTEELAQLEKKKENIIKAQAEEMKEEAMKELLALEKGLLFSELESHISSENPMSSIVQASAFTLGVSSPSMWALTCGECVWRRMREKFGGWSKMRRRGRLASSCLALSITSRISGNGLRPQMLLSSERSSSNSES